MSQRILKYVFPIFILFPVFIPEIAQAQTPDSLAWPLNSNNAGSGGVYMDPPETYTEEVNYDPATNSYSVIYKMGELEIGRETMTF